MPEYNSNITSDLMKLFNRKTEEIKEPQCKDNFFVDHTKGASTLKIDCEGCEKKSSLTDECCRKQIINKLIENSIDRIELTRRLITEEYEKDAVQKLKEISEIAVNIESSDFGVYGPECGECAKKIRNLRDTVVDSLKTDPIGTYQGLEAPVSKESIHTKPGCVKCATTRIAKLEYVKKSLKNSKLVSEAGKDPKVAYNDSFIAKSRPFISESRIALDVPKDATPLTKGYYVHGAKVRLYNVPTWNEDLYHITPPEYALRTKPHLLELLMQTREWLLGNASEQIESTDSSKSARHKFERFCKIRLLENAAQKRIDLTEKEAESLVSILMRCTRGLDVIELLLLDPNINDVYVNSPMETTPVYVKHKDFDDCRTNIYLTEDRGNNFVMKFVLKSGIGLSPNSPILDMDLDDLKTRVNVIAPPLSPDGLAFALRCRNDSPWTLPMLIENKTISAYGAAILSTMVNDQVAMLIVGGRGTGKTSFLGGIMSAMNPRYRVLTIEDTLELPVPELNESGFRVQRMLSRPITTNEGINISADDALRSSLRMGESSIVVGEVRGQEARVLYESIRVGATGNTVLGTIHGRSPRDVFERVVYDLRIPPTSFKATDIVVVSERLPVGRRVTEIAELNKDIDIENIRSGEQADRLFATLMRFDTQKDTLALPPESHLLDSQVLRKIAERRGVSVENIIEEISVRTKMYEQVIAWKSESNLREVLEINATVGFGKKFISLIDDERRKDSGRYRGLRYDKIYDKWMAWGAEYVQTLKT